MSLEQFQKQNYLNIETLRKSGQSVKTPVWFVQDGETFFVWTQENAGKAKRIRNNGAVRIAPCTSSGEVLGEWITARAQTNEAPEAISDLEKLMKKKYGIMFHIFGFLGRLRGGSKYTAIKIQV
jgi:PPOX class probable F420-dependent enzyme